MRTRKVYWQKTRKAQREDQEKPCTGQANKILEVIKYMKVPHDLEDWEKIKPSSTERKPGSKTFLPNNPVGLRILRHGVSLGESR